MELLLASNNAHKLEEFTRLFAGHSIVSPRQAGLSFDFEEGGNSFLENALGKALALYRMAKRPVLSDDSGLCVPALGGEFIGQVPDQRLCISLPELSGNGPNQIGVPAEGLEVEAERVEVVHLL